MKPLSIDELEGMRQELNALNENLDSRNRELERLLQEALRLINKVPNTRPVVLEATTSPSPSSTRSKQPEAGREPRCPSTARSTSVMNREQQLETALRRMIAASDKVTSAAELLHSASDERALNEIAYAKDVLMDATTAAEKVLKGGAA
jgi:hypothetical protein